jgi:hypothetical protein
VLHNAASLDDTTSEGGLMGVVITARRLSEIGKASRFANRTLGGSDKCQVFEVVLQSQEQTVCPAWVRDARRKERDAACLRVGVLWDALSGGATL